MKIPPVYTCIGHVCMDMKANEYALGGTVAYSSLTAHGFGFESKVLTSWGPNFLFEEDLSLLHVDLQKAPSSTVFKNVYRGNDRSQHIISRALDLESSHVVDSFSSSDIIHIAPIADEIDLAILDHLPQDVLTVITPQGWMRTWDEKGVVSFKDIPWHQLESADFVIMSEEDVPDLDSKMDQVGAHIKCLIITRAENGADIFIDESNIHIPSKRINPVDPTGAGDVFATAFICKYYYSEDVSESVIFAHKIAAQCITHKGLDFLHLLDKL